MNENPKGESGNPDDFKGFYPRKCQPLKFSEKEKTTSGSEDKAMRKVESENHCVTGIIWKGSLERFIWQTLQKGQIK